MKDLIHIILTISSLLILFISCSNKPKDAITVNELPSIFPDYVDITIPPNIAPLNFKLSEGTKGYVEVRFNEQRMHVSTNNGKIIFPLSQWKKTMQSAIGKDVEVKVFVQKDKVWNEYKSFSWKVSSDSIDPYMAYRLIEPGYELWNQMGIYQRHLENFKETPILENKMTSRNCMNCHSFCNQDPENMLFHMRATHPGTYLIQDGKYEKLNTKTPQTISALVYPSWHPSGKYVAFSTNITQQSFHMNDRNRVEVYDDSSDVVVYDIEKHLIITSPQLFSESAFETFPTFSPDGKTLYYCSSKAVEMPNQFQDVKYSLCAISFDPATGQFGTEVDTVFNAEVANKSVSFPRVSPDGQFLLYTLAEYGGFSIWHKDADLYMLNIHTKESNPLSLANSNDVESYHSWSSNSKWIVFSSRRVNGLYTMPYFAYIHPNGQADKPILLPQKDPDFYESFMKSYNIPEFIKGKVHLDSYKLSQFAKTDKGIDVTFSLKK